MKKPAFSAGNSRKAKFRQFRKKGRILEIAYQVRSFLLFEKVKFPMIDDQFSIDFQLSMIKIFKI
jgi:hypothetical protein